MTVWGFIAGLGPGFALGAWTAYFVLRRHIDGKSFDTHMHSFADYVDRLRNERNRAIAGWARTRERRRRPRHATRTR